MRILFSDYCLPNNHDIKSNPIRPIAVVFYEGNVKHIYFIAEPQGTMSSLMLYQGAYEKASYRGIF